MEIKDVPPVKVDIQLVMQRPSGTQPALCRSDDDPNAVLGVKMEPCITPYSGHDHKADEVNCLHGLLD
ncbi:hypothetical protein SOVF_065730 isoform A [Spinacia oleracea]|nr:hypothetical protein SOVF_065730 isoform A [Spinacia oleracea]